MGNATNSWLASILMSPRPRRTAFDLATSQSQVAEPVQYLADQHGRGASRTSISQQLDDEALAAQLAREAFAKRTRQSVRPEGGRQEGKLTEFVRDVVRDVMVPQSPLDYALLALGGPFPRAVKAGLIGLGAALEPSLAQAGIGKLVRGAGGVADHLIGRFAQYAGKYPGTGDPIRKFDPITGKEYFAKELTREAKELARARELIDKDMRRNGFEPYFPPDKRFHVNPSFYPPNVDTLAIIPKHQATFDKYMKIVGSNEARERLRLAYKRGLEIPNAKDMLALGQFEQAFIKELGPEAGRSAFIDWVTSVAATTAGATPRQNLLMAGYGNFVRHHPNLEFAAAAHQLPFPVGGRFAMSNLRKYQDTVEKGGWTALGAQNPKRHDYGQGMFGNPRAGVIDEAITSGMIPGLTVPPRGTYGIFQNVLHDEATRAGTSPAQFSDLARAGFIALKNPHHPPIQPMISDINDVIERAHRLTGMSHNKVVGGMMSYKIPYLGIGGFGILPSLQPQHRTDAPWQ